MVSEPLDRIHVEPRLKLARGVDGESEGLERGSSPPGSLAPSGARCELQQRCSQLQGGLPPERPVVMLADLVLDDDPVSPSALPRN